MEKRQFINIYGAYFKLLEQSRLQNKGIPLETGERMNYL